MNSVLEERTIYIRDLIAELVKKLWIILLVAVVFAVALTGYKYMSDSKQKNIVTELSDDEKSQVADYLSQKDVYDNLADYINNSEFMQLNPYKLHQGTISYYVSQNSGEMTGKEAVKIISDWINGGGVSDVDNELIGCGNEIESDKISIQDYDLNVLTVTVCAEKENDLSKYEAAIESSIEEYVSGNFANGSITLAKVSEVSAITSRNDIADNQQKISDNFTKLGNSLDEQYGQFTDLQKSAVEGVENTTQSAEESKVSINFKYLILGFVLGVFIAACVITVIYVIKGRLIVNDEIWEELGLANFGRIIVSEQNGFLTKLSNRIRGIKDESDSADIIASKIARQVNRGDTVILSGKIPNQENKESMLSIFEKKNIKVLCVENELKNPDIMDGISDNHKVVMFVYPYREKAKDIVKAVLEKNDCKINQIGIVELL